MPVVPVVFDAQSLATVAEGSGTGTYAYELLAALATVPSLRVVALSGPAAELPAGITRQRLSRRAARPRAAVIEHSLRLPIELLSTRPRDSVFHSPTFHAPPAVRRPWVQTLHDVIPLLFDSPDTAALRARWKRLAPRYRRASAVIAISEHVASSGVTVLGLDRDRIHVAHHGVSPVFRPGTSGPTDPPYLLVVGEYSRRKGYAEAFAVVDALADAGYPHRLIVAGRVHEWARPEVASLRNSARHPDRIDLRGFVPDLVPLYQGATGFLMTSRYEGFGLPVLEAMACGVPLVAFANSAVPEVVGDGGLLVADGDVAAMIGAMQEILDTPALAQEWRERGLIRARHFTWDRSAAVHAEVYRLAAGAA
jgi:alpha-1,3-rhamnosyl/mannosyltransferase